MGGPRAYGVEYADRVHQHHMQQQQQQQQQQQGQQPGSLQFGVYDQYADYQKKIAGTAGGRTRRRASLGAIPSIPEMPARFDRRTASASHEASGSSTLADLPEEPTPLSRQRKSFSETNLAGVDAGAPWSTGVSSSGAPSGGTTTSTTTQFAFGSRAVSLSNNKVHSSSPDVPLLFSLFSVLEQPNEEDGDTQMDDAPSGSLHHSHTDATGGSALRGSGMSMLPSPLLTSPVRPKEFNADAMMMMSGNDLYNLGLGSAPPTPTGAASAAAAAAHSSDESTVASAASATSSPSAGGSSLRHRLHMAAPTINTSLLPTQNFMPMYSAGLEAIHAQNIVPMSPHTSQLSQAQLMHEEVIAHAVSGTPTGHSAFGLFSPGTNSLFSPSGSSGMSAFGENTSLLSELADRLN